MVALLCAATSNSIEDYLSRRSIDLASKWRMIVKNLRRGWKAMQRQVKTDGSCLDDMRALESIQNHFSLLKGPLAQQH